MTAAQYRRLEARLVAAGVVKAGTTFTVSGVAGERPAPEGGGVLRSAKRPRPNNVKEDD